MGKTPAGYAGHLLVVDLSVRQIQVVPLPERWQQDYVGGSGIAARALWEENGLRFGAIDPLGPENTLVFMTGPLTGLPLPGASRMVAAARSPLTGIWGESNVGGFAGAALKAAGFDGVVVRGRAAEPVYLVIGQSANVYADAERGGHDGRVPAEIKSAADLWGLDTYETTDILLRRVRGGIWRRARGSGDATDSGPDGTSRQSPRPCVLTIGPAGENGVLFASIVHKGHVLGRTGLGAVMGSKNLKAIVISGSGRVTAADPERVAALRRRLTDKVKESIALAALAEFGTNTSMEVGPLMGDVPTMNWQLGSWEDGWAAIGPAAFKDEGIIVGKATCFACPVACKRVAEVRGDDEEHGWCATKRGPGPEYETVAAFGSLCLIDDPYAIAYLNDLCNRYGLDTISCGATIAFAIECFEKGLLTTADTGGRQLQWGDARLVAELIHEIGQARGFGLRLGRGSARLAEEIPGSEAFLTTVKKLEAPMHDPRAGHAMGLAYATSVRGACHMSGVTLAAEQGTTVYAELGFADYIEPKESTGKAELVVKTQDFGMVFGGAAVLCQLAGWVWTEADLAEALEAVTGTPWSLKRVLEAGERIWLLKRALGYVCGARPQDDGLPRRLREPLADGGAAGSVPDIDAMLREFYRLRGLEADGRPRSDRLREVGLDDVADALARQG